MLGNIVNVFGILLGSFLGLFFKKKIKEETLNNVLKAVGIVVMIIGLIGLIKAMIYIEGEVLKSKNELALLLCLSFGIFFGEILRVDYHLNRFGLFIEKKINKGSFYKGFINASLVFCIGAMAIIGSISAAMGDHKILYLKATIDAITAMILASSLGFGVIFSSLSVFIYQGLIIVITYFLGDFLSAEFIDLFNTVGYSIVIAIGINFVFGEKIKIANMLPSLIFAIIYYLFYYLF